MTQHNVVNLVVPMPNNVINGLCQIYLNFVNLLAECENRTPLGLCDHRLSEPDVKRRGMNETYIKPII